MMVKFHGENPLVGKFELMRNGNWRVDSNQIDAQWSGKAIFAKGPLAVFLPLTPHPLSTSTLTPWSSMLMSTRSSPDRSWAFLFLRTRSTFPAEDLEHSTHLFFLQKIKIQKMHLV